MVDGPLEFANFVYNTDKFTVLMDESGNGRNNLLQLCVRIGVWMYCSLVMYFFGNAVYELPKQMLFI